MKEDVLQFSEKDAAAFVEAHQTSVIRLRKTITNLVAVKQVLYFYNRLQQLKMEDHTTVSNDCVMEAEAFFSTIVMSYGRLFAESNGTPVFKKKLIPKDLLDTHEEIISFRNERYAHHGNHDTTAAEIELFVGEYDVQVNLHWRASMYLGAPPHWLELFEWVDEFLKLSFSKQIKHLSATSGKEWISFEPDMDLTNITIDKVENLKLGPLAQK